MSYDNFPEVYHAHGITTPPFTGAERPVTGQGANTIYRRKISLWRSTYCVFRPLRAGGRKAGPEPPEIGSVREDKDIIIINAIIFLNYCINSTIVINAIIIRFCYLKSQISSC